MDSTPEHKKLELVYTLFCDDVRLEVGNKLSYMGVFQTIVVPQLPVWLPKLAVVNHWRGEGAHLSEVRILMPPGRPYSMDLVNAAGPLSKARRIERLHLERALLPEEIVEPLTGKIVARRPTEYRPLDGA